ncbi:MAG: tetratricopeptide repeat protein, partial [Myxococcota bacterium]
STIPSLHRFSTSRWMASASLNRARASSSWPSIRFRVAQAYFTQALAIHQEVGDRGAEGKALGNLATLNRMEGQLDEARARFSDALAIHREVENRCSEGIVLGELGLIEVMDGKAQDALTVLRQGEAILREINDPLQLGFLLCKRARAEHLANRPDAAVAALDEAEQIAEDINIGPDGGLAQKIAEAKALLDE